MTDNLGEHIDVKRQKSLFSRPRLTRGPLIARDTGLVGGCKTYLYLDENGTEYYGKTNQPHHQYLILNEIVASNLASLLGIKTPETRIGAFKGKPVFLSKSVNDQTRGALAIISRLRKSPAAIQAPDETLMIACFDQWIMNTDRHLDNILCVPINDHFELCAIDHDRSLFGVSNDPGSLYRHDNRPCSSPEASHQGYTHLPRAVGAKPRDLVSCIRQIREVDDDAIEKAVNDDRLADIYDTGLATSLSYVLKQRRDQIAHCMNDAIQNGQLAAAFGGN